MTLAISKMQYSHHSTQPQHTLYFWLSEVGDLTQCDLVPDHKKTHKRTKFQFINVNKIEYLLLKMSANCVIRVQIGEAKLMD